MMIETQNKNKKKREEEKEKPTHKVAAVRKKEKHLL